WTLDYQRRWLMSESASEQHSEKNKYNHDPDALQSQLATQARATLVAELAAGPETPAQPHDLRAAFRAKIWTIICEERQRVRIIVNSRKKQQFIEQKRPKSARLKNSGRAGILCRPISMRHPNPLYQAFIFAL